MALPAAVISPAFTGHSALQMGLISMAKLLSYFSFCHCDIEEEGVHVIL